MERENQSTHCMENYKPILVCYFDHNKINDLQLSELNKSMKEVAGKSGYENIVMFGVTDCEARIEIISVNKATVVEDIQKYIDTKLFEKNEDKVKFVDTVDYKSLYYSLERNVAKLLVENKREHLDPDQMLRRWDTIREIKKD